MKEGFLVSAAVFVLLSAVFSVNVLSQSAGCVEGTTRACGPDLGVCMAGISSCVGGKWSECVGAKGPESEYDICGNRKDDNCDGNTDEGCSGYEQRCSDGERNWNELGVDCGGSCPESCAEMPWIWLMVIGFGLFIFAVALHYKNRSGGMIESESIGTD